MELSLQQRAELLKKLQDYFSEHLEHKLEQFDGEFLLDFLEKNLGV